MIYILLGLDENWLSYRAPQPRIEVVGRAEAAGEGHAPFLSPGIAKGMAKWRLTAGRNSPSIVKNGRGTA